MIPGWLEYDVWSLVLGMGAGLACGFLNTAASSGSAVSLPILMMIGLDPISANATNRVPVLIGALSATVSFSQRKVLPWALAVKVSLPVAIGGLGGAGRDPARPRACPRYHRGHSGCAAAAVDQAQAGDRIREFG